MHVERSRRAGSSFFCLLTSNDIKRSTAVAKGAAAHAAGIFGDFAPARNEFQRVRQASDGLVEQYIFFFFFGLWISDRYNQSLYHARRQELDFSRPEVQT